MIRIASGIVSDIAPAPYMVPAWLRDERLAALDARFAAGAALSALDKVMREDCEWRGVWMQRLALRAAAGACVRLGKTDDERALRDLWQMRGSDGALGPSGSVLMAFQQLVGGDPMQYVVLAAVARNLGLGEGAVEPGIGRVLSRLARGVPPLAAAGEAAGLMAKTVSGPAVEVFALWVADAVLARTLGWPVALPLHSIAMAKPGGHHRRPGLGGSEWREAAATGIGAVAVSAVDLASEMARRAARLRAVAPKVRTKQALLAIEALLSQDAVTPAQVRGKMSDRAARRLFDRLVTLGGVRELSGRPSFRIYGL